MCNNNSVYSSPRKHAMHTKRHSAARTDRLNRRNARPSTPLADLDYNTHDASFTTSNSSDNYYNSNTPRTFQRFNLVNMENSCSLNPRSSGGLTSTIPTDDHAYHNFSLTPGARPRQYNNHNDSDQTLLQPPSICATTMPTTTTSVTGLSLFVPFSPTPNSGLQAYTHTRYSFGGTIRTLGAGGRSGSCGGGGRDGDSPEPSGVHPGQGENEESNATGGEDESDGSKLKPSSYTFRRRNAIVEGSEDAPKADDFPDRPSK